MNGNLVTATILLFGLVILLACYAVAKLSRFLFRVVNAKTRKPLPKRYETGASIAGLALLAFVIWNGLRDVSVTLPSGSLSLTTVEHHPFKVSFKVQGDLYLSETTCCISDQPEYLCQQRWTGYVRISSLNQLKGWVEIKTDAEALAYVRLQTDDATWWSFPDHMFEITPEEDSIHLSYGVGMYSMNGKVTPQWMRDHHIPSPSVVRTATGWAIHRVCVQTEVDKSTLMNVTEEVGPDGSYHRDVKRFTVNPPSKMDWEHEMQG